MLYPNAPLNPPKLALLATSLLCATAIIAQTTVTTPVVGYVQTVLPQGTGSVFAPSLIHSTELSGTFTGVIGSFPVRSNLSVETGSLTGGAFNELTSGDTVTPRYYLEIMNDTDNSPGSPDTEGLILDIIVNFPSSIQVTGNAAELGINGDEEFEIRKHLTLGEVFEGAEGLQAFVDIITIYNASAPGSIESFTPNGSDSWVSISDFVTDGTSTVIHPGTGIIVNNPLSPITVTITGNVKETPTQVSLYGNEVNILAPLKPVENLNMVTNGDLTGSLGAYTDVVTKYTPGSLTPEYSGVSDGSGAIVNISDFVTPVDVVIDGTSDALVVNAFTDTSVKLSSVEIN